MTVLSAAADAATELNQSELTALFSVSTDAGELPRELRRLVNKTAEAIAKAKDWQALKTLHTVTGDGSTVAHSLPDDYDRMLKDGEIHSSRFSDLTFTPAEDLNQWQFLTSSGLNVATPGNWIIIGGKLNIYPAMAVGETASFYYISSYYASAADGTPQASFTADGDLFRLADRLLTAGLIWRWRKQKGKDFSDDLVDYNTAMNEDAGNDSGTNIIVVGRRRLRANTRFAYPGRLGP